jgi:O-antigen/teichoic acid export membrane protein
MSPNRTALISRILLSVVALAFIFAVGWWAWAGYTWLAILMGVGGLAFLVWLWLPVIRGGSKPSSR